ncbi:hypothetical protein DINM_021692 [Dirofilaria immitis]|nr:hypothetical protein [Dirofilaria immitis]
MIYTGKPEWQKIGNVERCTTNNCCLHNPKVQTDIVASSFSSRPTENIQTNNDQTNVIKTGVSWRGSKQTTTITSKSHTIQEMNSYQQLSEQYANKTIRMFQYFYSILKYSGINTVYFIIWLYSIICGWLISLGNSMTISGTSSGNIRNQKEEQKTSDGATAEEVKAELQQQNHWHEQQQQQQQQQQSFSTDAQMTFQKWSPVEQSIIQPVPPKGGVAVLPLDIMVEAHARVKERERRLSEQKPNYRSFDGNNNLIFTSYTIQEGYDWTVTSKRFVPLKWKAAASKLEVKSTVKNKANEDDEILKPIIREAEEMRDRVNRRMTETPSESVFDSRLNTPLDDFSMTSHTNIPFDITLDSRTDSYSGYSTSRSHSQSRIQTVFSPPFAKQMHSPRRWPPQSNATGVYVAKDNWNIIPTEIVSCRRITERSVIDKWTTRDEKGSIMDEWSLRSWKGETDELRRRTDGTGEMWHHKVEISPGGNASFVNNRRLYTRDYVVESETRNAQVQP